MQGLLLAEALDRVRNDWEHRMFLLVATADATGGTKIACRTGFLVRIVQLCHTLTSSPAREPVLRRESALKTKWTSWRPQSIFLQTGPSRLARERTDHDLRHQQRGTIPKVLNQRQKEKTREKQPFL